MPAKKDPIKALLTVVLRQKLGVTQSGKVTVSKYSLNLGDSLLLPHPYLAAVVQGNYSITSTSPAKKFSGTLRVSASVASLNS